MLEDVVNELGLPSWVVEMHTTAGKSPADLVRLVIDAKERLITAFLIWAPPINTS